MFWQKPLLFIFLLSSISRAQNVVCPADIQMSATATQNELAVSWVEPTPDGTPSNMESTHDPGALFGIGRHAVLYTASYASGVSATCFFYVTITATDGRASPDILRCPTDRTPLVYEAFDNVNCSLPFEPPIVNQKMVTFTTTHTPRDMFDIGTYHVVYTFTNIQGFVTECVIPINISQGTDVCGCNPCPVGNTCNSMVATPDVYTCVMDAGDLAPTIDNCPEDLVVILPNGMTSVNVTWTVPIASDDVDIVSLISNYEPGEAFTPGNTQVVYVTTDGLGQSTYCVFSVEVSPTADISSPVFMNCPATVSVALAIGEDNATAMWTPPTATDTDGAVTVESTRSPGDTFSAGIILVIYTATDEVGLQATCAFNVILEATEDRIPPVISNCPFAVVAESGDILQWVLPTAVDNGVNVPVTSGPQIGPGVRLADGIFGPFLYTFVDLAGNEAICEMNIFVSDRSDTVPPTLTSCDTSDVIAVADPGAFTATVTWTPPSATDDRTFQFNLIITATNSPGDSFGVGRTPVTYVFIDEQGNSVKCEFDVLVVPDPSTNDVAPPEFSGCPSNVVLSAPFGATSTIVTWTVPTAGDTEGQVTVTSPMSPGESFPVGVTTITYTAIDMTGLQALCTFNLIARAGVVDNINPVLTCPQFIFQQVELGTPTVEVAFDDPVIMDESNTAMLSSSSHVSPFNFSVETQTEVIFMARDQSGNVGSCSFQVFFSQVDTTPPVVTCPEPLNLTVELGELFLNVSFPNANVTDLGQVSLINQSHMSGDLFPVGVTTNVLIIYQDDSSNIGECSFTITVNAVDTTPPNVTCPTTVFETVELGLNSTSLTFPNDTTSATDISGMPTLLSITPPSGSMFPIGITPVTVVYTDSSNNQGSCMFNVNVTAQDTVPPTLVCPGPFFEIIELGQSPFNVTFDDPIISDASKTGMVVSQTHNSGDLFPAGVTRVNFTASDQAGNENSCSFTIFISEVDSTNPVLTCPANITGPTAELGLATLPVAFGNPTIMDVSNTTEIISSSHMSPGPFPVGETTKVTFTARDQSGNEGSCSFTITVNAVDTTDPVLTCPADIDRTVELGPANVSVSFSDPIVFDFSNTSLSSSHPSPGPFPVDTTTDVIFTATDLSGNDGTCSFRISIITVDTTPPTVTCPADISRIVETPQSLSVTFDNATATDLSGTTVLVSQTHQSGSMFTFGVTMVRFTFEDLSGNSDFCEFSITLDTDQCLSSPCINGTCMDNVNSFDCICDPGFDGLLCDTADTTPPVVTCPASIDLNVEVDQPGPFEVTFENATAMDTSGVVILVSRSHDSGSDFPIGQTVVTFVFEDGTGNSNNCSFLISITAVDDTPPTLTCPADMAVTVEPGVPGRTVTFDLATATDNSGTAILVTFSPPSGSLFPLGSNSVIFIFADQAGNQDTCFFLINVTEVDMMEPEATCPQNVIAVAQPGASYATVMFSAPTATDNAGMPSLVDISSESGSNFTLGITIVTARFTDVADNIGTCSFAVVITGENATVTVSDLGTDFIEVTWTDDVSMGIVAYVITLSDVGGAVLEMRNFSPSPSIVQRFDQLTPGTQYMIDVDAVISAPADFAALNVVTRPKGAENVTAYELSDVSYFFRWDPPSPPDNFFIDYTLRYNRSVAAADVARILQPRRSSVLEGLVSGAQYMFEFFTTIGPTMSDPSVLTNIPLGSPADMGIRAVTAQELEVYRNDSSTMTLVRLFSEDGLEEYEKNVEPGTTSIVFVELQPNTMYQMIAVTADTVVAADTGLTNFLDGISFIDVTPDSVQLTWVPPPASTLYVISYISQNTTSTGVQASALPTAVVSNLEPQTLYTFSVVAVTGFERTNIGSVTTITGNPNQPPVINNCPNDTSEVLSDTSSFVSVTWTPPMAVDDNGIPVLLTTNQPGSFFGYGLTVVTYTATDSGGLSDNCSFIVNVTDVTPPTISGCPSGASGFLIPGDSTVQVFWPRPTEGDNSGMVTVMSTHNPGDGFPFGETEVTYTAVDAAGNLMMCTFNVSVTPDPSNQPPMLSDCPANVSATLTPSSSMVMATWTPPNATDDNDTPLLTSSHQPGTLFGLGSTVVTYTATDSENLTDTCTFYVVVGAPINQPPMLSDCPANVSATLTSTSPMVMATWTPPNATDDNDTPDLTSSHRPGSMFGFGSTVVTYTATDSESLTDVCSFYVVVGDDTDPVLSNCPMVNSLVASQGTTTALALWSIPIVVDNSGMVTISSTHSSGNFFDVGSTDVMYTATDAAGNTATCNFTVVVRAFPDDPIRLIDCPTGASGILPMFSNEVMVAWTPPTSDGGTGLTTVTSDRQPGSLFGYGETRVTYTATDSDGFTVSCSFLVDVADDSNPVISDCPVAVTGEVPQGSTVVSVPWTPPTAADNSGMVTLMSTRQPNEQFMVGTFAVVYTATDPAGNTDQCSFQVTVTAAPGGTPGPMFDGCPSNPVGTLPSTSAQVAVSWTAPTVPSGTNDVTVTSNMQPGDLFGFGSTTVTYQAMDSNGLTDTCSFEVQVTDMIDPIISGCPTSAVGVVPQGSTNVSVFWIESSHEDNSGMVTLTSDRSPGDAFPIGSFPVVYTSRDMAGNTDSCSFFVNVTMSTGEVNPGPELMNCPTDVTETLPATTSQIAVTWSPPTATDDASIPVVTSDREPGSMFGYGSTTVTYTARDSQGVADTCSFTVRVGDLNNPVIMGCPDAGATGILPPGSTTVPVSWTPPTQIDNSGVSTFMSTHIPGSAFRLGTTEVLYTATDIADNAAECRFIVTVTSPGVTNPPPVISNCPTRILGVLTPSSDQVAVSWTSPTATDNSGTPTLTSDIRSGSMFGYGIRTVTYTAEDDGGAIATCVFNVQVQDVTPPVISDCPFSASVTLLPGSTTVEVTWTPPTQVDNSGVSTLTSTHSSGSMFSAGETEVVYTAVDTPGNIVRCSFVVTVTLLSAVRCVVPPVTTNLNSIGGQCMGPVMITFNAQCNYQCNAGFSVVGDQTVSCGMDGNLDGTFPICQDTNECNVSTSCADSNSFCLNTIGSFMCICNQGFERAVDGSCQVIQSGTCSANFCENSGNCVDTSGSPSCECPTTFTGSLCQIDLSCGAVTCHASQACANGQCACPEGTQLVQGQCQDECTASCDQFTETCSQSASGGFMCSCRPDRDRSYWTNTCIARARVFIIRFAITRVGIELVNFNANYENPQSAEYIAAASAIENLLPQILLAQGVQGIINVRVVRFFQGSLMVEISVPVSDQFTGDASTIRDAIFSYLNNNDDTLSDGTHQLEIDRQIQTQETTQINECADGATNDCSENGICVNDVPGVGYTCQCLQGFVDLYPNTLPGRNCVPFVIDINECSTSTPCSDQNSFCLNTIGSFMCVCDEGFDMAPNGSCQVQVGRCLASSCQNSGTCAVGATGPTCDCPNSFTGPECEIDLRCGNADCHISQVCSNDQCVCPVGTELFLGSCRDQCNPNCDLMRETCTESTTGVYSCECRASRDRSYWTDQCVTRIQAFFIRFIIARIGTMSVDFGVQYANEQSQEYQAAVMAISNLFPQILRAQGIRGIINVRVVRFFAGSLGVECRIPVSSDFTGTENTILDAIRSYLNDNDDTLSDGTFQLEIPGDSVTSGDIAVTTRAPVQTEAVVSGDVNIGLIVGIVVAVVLLMIIIVVGVCILFARLSEHRLGRKPTVRPADYGTDDMIYRLAASVPNVYFQNPGSIENTPPPQQNNTPPSPPQKKRQKRPRKKGPFFHHPW